MGLVFLVVIWLITFISAYFFIAKTWWLPVGASAAAAGIDHHFASTYMLMGIVSVASQLALGYFAWQYRARSGSTRQALYSHGNGTLEITWTILDADFIRRPEFHEQVDLGLRTFSPSGFRCRASRSDRHAVRLVFSLSRMPGLAARMQPSPSCRILPRAVKARSASTPLTQLRKTTSSLAQCMFP